MLQEGDKYVLNSSDTLYRISNSSCTEGSQVNIQGQTVVRFRLIEGKWYAQDFYSIGNYSNASYICHVYNDVQDFYNPSFAVLPATIIVLCLLSCIFHWFLRLRG